MLQPVFIAARDICLLPAKIFEISYNEVLIGPVLTKLGIDAPLNVTSYLKFGAGSRRVLGEVVTGTTSALASASPEKVGIIWKWLMKK